MKAKQLKPMKVMVIDDEPAILKIMAESLRQRGYEVETYGSATECLDAYQGNSTCQKHSDVILTDIDMPRMNGIEFLDLLQNRNCPCQHIAVMTGGMFDDARLHKIKQRGCKVFMKPFSVAEFIDWLSLIQIPPKQCQP